MPYVVLKDGTKILSFTYNAVMQVILKMCLIAPALLEELIKKCNDPLYLLEQEHLELLNIEFHLVDENGNVPDEIQRIVRSYVRIPK